MIKQQLRDRYSENNNETIDYLYFLKKISLIDIFVPHVSM